MTTTGHRLKPVTSRGVTGSTGPLVTGSTGRVVTGFSRSPGLARLA